MKSLAIFAVFMFLFCLDGVKNDFQKETIGEGSGSNPEDGKEDDIDEDEELNEDEELDKDEEEEGEEDEDEELDEDEEEEGEEEEEGMNKDVKIKEEPLEEDDSNTGDVPEEGHSRQKRMVPYGGGAPGGSGPGAPGGSGPTGHQGHRWKVSSGASGAPGQSGHVASSVPGGPGQPGRVKDTGSRFPPHPPRQTDGSPTRPPGKKGSVVLITGNIIFPNTPGKLDTPSCLLVSLEDTTRMDAPSIILSEKTIDLSNQYVTKTFKYTLKSRRPRHNWLTITVHVVLNNGWCAKNKMSEWLRKGDYLNDVQHTIKFIDGKNEYTKDVNVMHYVDKKEKDVKDVEATSPPPTSGKKEKDVTGVHSVPPPPVPAKKKKVVTVVEDGSPPPSSGKKDKVPPPAGPAKKKKVVTVVEAGPPPPSSGKKEKVPPPVAPGKKEKVPPPAGPGVAKEVTDNETPPMQSRRPGVTPPMHSGLPGGVTRPMQSGRPGGVTRSWQSGRPGGVTRSWQSGRPGGTGPMQSGRPGRPGVTRPMQSGRPGSRRKQAGKFPYVPVIETEDSSSFKEKVVGTPSPFGRSLTYLYIKGNIIFPKAPGTLKSSSCLRLTLKDTSRADAPSITISRKYIDLSDQYVGKTYQYKLTAEQPDNLFLTTTLQAVLNIGWCGRGKEPDWIHIGDYLNDITHKIRFVKGKEEYTKHIKVIQYMR